MVSSKTCSFCGKKIEPGSIKMYVKKDGTVFYFCNNKCNKNMIKLKRLPRKTKWTEEYRNEKAFRLQLEKKKSDDL